MLRTLSVLILILAACASLDRRPSTEYVPLILGIRVGRPNLSYLGTICESDFSLRWVQVFLARDLDGIAYARSTRTLFAIDHFPGIYWIDVLGHEAHLIGRNDKQIGALAVEPKSETLFGLAVDGSLYRIDKETGSPLLVGNSNKINYGHGLAFRRDGSLFVSDTSGAKKNSRIFVVDPRDGSATQVATINVDYLVGLAFDENDTLYGLDNGSYGLGNGSRGVIKIDLETETHELIAKSSEDFSFSAMEFVPRSVVHWCSWRGARKVSR